MGDSRRPRASRRIRWAGVLLGALLTAGACAPVAPPPTPTGLDPALLALLDDPEFVASLGSTEEEREQIIRDIRALFEDSSSIQFDGEQLRAMATEKDAHDAAVAQQEEADRAAEAAATKAEAGRLDALKAGPTFDELVEEQTDGSENYDYSLTPQHWAGVDGATETFREVAASVAAESAKVDAVVAELTAAGRLAEVDAIPGYVPPQGQEKSLFAQIWHDKFTVRTATGVCAGRQGNRHAPGQAGLRPGTIYTPLQNTFTGPSGIPEYVGDLVTTTIDGQKVLIVEGHLGDLNDIGNPLLLGHIWTHLRGRISVHLPESVPLDHDGAGPYKLNWIPGQPVVPGTVQALCYIEDLNPAPNQAIRRAMFRAYIPWEDEAQNLTIKEPGFQVRATVSDLNEPPALFAGSDMRTVYLGQKPLGYNGVFEDGGFGVSIGKGVVVDDNQVTGDDLESSLRAPVSNAITSALTSIEGMSDWVLGPPGGNYGWFGFHVNNSAPTTPNVDIDWVPTKVGGNDDDEFRLKGTVSMKDWLIEGYDTLGLVGLIPCYFKFKVDWSASIYASIDINDNAPTMLQPDLQFADIWVDRHSVTGSSLPPGCLLNFYLQWDNWLTNKMEEKLPTINASLANQMALQPAVDQALPATIPLGPGQAIQSDFFGFNNTCAIYDCNGEHAGDMAMSWAGIEATGDIRVTDSKPVGDPRRFPFSLNPTTVSTAHGRVRQHFGPQNEITDFGGWVSPALLNQALRAITEEGVLDVDLNPTTLGTAKSLPIYLDKPVAADKPLGFWLPHLELDPTQDLNLFAVDFYLGVGVDFDSGTRKLVPADISPTDPGFGVQVWTLRCDSALWIQCEGLTTLASDVLNWGANELLDPLLEASIGEVKIPSTGNFNLTGLKILNEDGHLGIRVSVGAPQLRIWGGIDASTYFFDTYFEGLPDTGPVTYHWVIQDVFSGAVLMDYTGPTHQFSGLDSSVLTPFTLIGGSDFVSVKATVTATRGNGTITSVQQVGFVLP